MSKKCGFIKSLFGMCSKKHVGIGAHDEPICYGQTKTWKFAQEWYESASRDAGKRTRQLKKAGFRNVRSSSMGYQVTPVGSVKMTLVDIRPNEPGGELPELPYVRIERMSSGIGEIIYPTRQE